MPQLQTNPNEQLTKLNFWSDQTAEEVETEIRNCQKSLEENLESLIDNGSRCVSDSAGFTIELWFSETVFCLRIVLALKALFRFIAEARDQARKKHSTNNAMMSSSNTPFVPPILVSRIQLDRCAGNLHANQSLQDALHYDVVETLCVDGRLGDYDLLTSPALSNLSTPPIHLKELDLRYFRITKSDIEALQKGILNPALLHVGGGLQRLSLCNTTFQDDGGALEAFADAVSQLTQKPKQDEEEEEEKGSFLENLWLYYCGLKDHQLEKIMQSLMTAKETSTAAVTTNRTVESTLRSLTVEQAKCGPNFYSLLGAWLFRCETPLLPPTTRATRTLCGLRAANIFIWSALTASQQAAAIDPVEILNEIGIEDPAMVNTKLQTLCLSGVNDTEGLGRLVSEHFVGLESLQLHSRGSSDTGLTMDQFSSFVSGSSIPAVDPIELLPEDVSKGRRSTTQAHPGNRVLRTITFHCADKDTRTKLENCTHLEELLERFPMLRDVRFGFKRSGSSRDRAQQMMNANASGRFLFFPPLHKPDGLPISLWPTVLEGFHKRLTAESQSMYDDNMRAWVESGSFGDGAGDEDDDQSDTDDDDDEGDDEDGENSIDNNEGEERFELDMEVVHRKNSQVAEQSASAIFSLLKPNMEGLIFLRNSEEAQKGLKRNMETLSISRIVDNSKKLRREDST